MEGTGSAGVREATGTGGVSLPSHAGTLERLLRRDRLLIAAALGGLAALAWVYLLRMADGMSTTIAMPHMETWSHVDLVFLAVMWAVMMVAMMLPSAGPMCLAFASVQRRRREKRQPYVATATFAAGYLTIWSVYAIGGTLAQWGLHDAALLSPMMVSTSPVLGGALLVAAGVFQLTPLKHVCLARCRSPLGFLVAEWREGTVGAFTMGARHGLYCVGCCWILMALLFVAGVMNLLWVAAIAAFVLVEKGTRAGARVGQIAGVLLTAAGLYMAATGLL